MLFQPPTPRELRAAVERERAAVLFVQFFQPPLDLSVHVVCVLRSNLHDDREPRLAIDERCQTARALFAEHEIALEVAEPQPLLDHLGPVFDPRRVARKGRFSPRRTLPTPPQKALPMRAMFVALDPRADRLRRHGGLWFGLWLVGLLLFRAAGDLLRRPLVDQASADALVELRPIHLSHQRPLRAAPLGHSLRRRGMIHAARAIAAQLATDRRWAAPDRPRDFFLAVTLKPQLRYPIALVARKMTGHRWDSVPKGKAFATSPIGNSQRCFLRPQFPRLRRGAIAFEI